ncbi:MAG: DUF1638 domain-containing protein [Desulfobacteraceae bacterium]|nr:DUF1638 domain-containing protein [Desulfobacteraceae bacterium]MCF8095864.1 DUF1638 domain-containing protein [Desulfobacteraceae bacterium]
MTKSVNALNSSLSASVPRVIIACRVIEYELEALRRKSGDNNIEIRYLDQNLHRTPEKMPDIIQAQVDAVSDYAERIVLGYGLCSNGIVGVTAGKQKILIPRIHDCIALLLGSRRAYFNAFNERAGTYYLTPGWVAEEKDPLGMVENEYTPKMGREMAQWGIHEELKHYTHIVLINTGVGDIEKLRKRARANAEFLGKTYEEVRGSDAYFKKILFGPYDSEDFVCIEPGQKAKQKPFMKQSQ